MTWTRAIPLERLAARGQLALKLGDRQLALFRRGERILACNNRCPHEGYPLAEGTLDAGCVLTCNWHNWKFDLGTGANLTGGDGLRIYPTRVVDGEVEVDLADPPPAARQAAALAHLAAAFDDHDYERIARELARFAKAGGDWMEGVRLAIMRSHDRLEYGATHAYAGVEAWLRLRDDLDDPAQRLSCLVEAVAHCAWDALREPSRPFTAATRRFAAEDFLDAVEAQDEDGAVARLRGALADGLGIEALAGTLTHAALAHYADFGHSLIYVAHAERLVARLGRAIEAPLLLALVRSLVNASREDLIPEFRAYAPSLAAWPRAAPAAAGEIAPETLRGAGVEDSLARTLAAARTAAPGTIHAALLGANALNLLHFDLAVQDRIDNAVTDNVGWLDVTHGVTFANAVRRQCSRFPALWPQGLLQMACFVGRNRRYSDAAIECARWLPQERAAFLAACRARLLDHGERDYIHAVHYLKTTLAAVDELEAGPPPAVAAPLLAGLNRFLNSPLKRKHVARTARQALAVVARED